MFALRRFSSCLWVAAATLIVAAACNRSDSSAPFQIRLVDGPAPDTSYLEVSGVGSSALYAVRRLDSSSPMWGDVLRVHVARPDGTPASLESVAGKYTVVGDTLRFTPLFPFDRGRTYDVVYCGAGFAAGQKPECIEKVVSLPAGPAAAPTHVTQIFPSGDVVPENQLRLYIQFSAPMGRRGGIEHIKLLDDRGRQVEDPFLPLDAEFWNADRTRYTVFFDPGRQKRGILPNRQMGPSLVEGKTYTLVVDRAWIDGNGNPLSETFTRRFRVGPPDLSPLDTANWKISAPAAGTRDALRVTFPETLDHGLLLRAVGVKRDGQAVVGEVRIDEGERRWALIPEQSWQPGRYELIALSILEDLAGNRIGRAFEVDNFERVDKAAEPEVTAIPFALLPSR
jgi:hypothetical protein